MLWWTGLGLGGAVALDDMGQGFAPQVEAGAMVAWEDRVGVRMGASWQRMRLAGTIEDERLETPVTWTLTLHEVPLGLGVVLHPLGSDVAAGLELTAGARLWLIRGVMSTDGSAVGESGLSWGPTGSAGVVARFGSAELVARVGYAQHQPSMLLTGEPTLRTIEPAVVLRYRAVP